jgi:hypothetical protein
MLPITVTLCQSPEELEPTWWRTAPSASSSIYNCPFDISAKDDVLEVTLQSLYLSRTVVH